jgi:glycosyltransferase involved in cell wall biosynthesis
LRVTQVSLVRPRGKPAPGALLEEWPTLRDVALATRRAGAEVTVIQPFHRSAELTLDGVRFLFAPGRLTRAVAASRPEIIHVHGLEFAWQTRRLCGLGVPVLAQDHCSFADWRPWRRRWGLKRVAGAAFTHADQAAPFLGNGSLRSDLPVFAVPESSTRFTPGDRGQARAACGIFGDPAVLWVGRLTARKDPMTALDAIERAAADLPGLRLWCCFHETDLLAEMRKRITASPRLSERVYLLGPKPHREIEILCRAADLFLACSHDEGSGYSLIEALACGAAPVVSDIPPFRALTHNGAVGALAPIRDAGTFARGLVEVARQPAAERRDRTIRHFQQNLSFDAVGTQLLRAYRSLA